MQIIFLRKQIIQSIVLTCLGGLVVWGGLGGGWIVVLNTTGLYKYIECKRVRGDFKNKGYRVLIKYCVFSEF